jgi:hypothetical protein
VKRAVLGTLALLTCLSIGWVTLAHADTAHLVAYPYERVWPAAVRFLRVDQKLKIVEKDQESGYVLFELTDDHKTFQGSLQLSRTKDPDRREATRLALKIGGRPSYVEDELLLKLERKLKDELGDPAPAPAPAAPTAPDAGPAPGAKPKTSP